MSAQQAVTSWRGQMSIWIGRPAGSGPLPGSWPTPCHTDATITSGGQGAPCSAQASRSVARTSSASKGFPSTSRRPSADGRARASSPAAAVIPASAARCAARMPSSSAGDFARRRSSTAASSIVRTTPSSRRRSPSASGKSPGTIASVDADLLDRANLGLPPGLGEGQAALDKVLEPEREVVEHLGIGPCPLHPRRARGGSSGHTGARRPRRTGANRRSESGSRGAARRNAPCPRRAAARARARPGAPERRTA